MRVREIKNIIPTEEGTLPDREEGKQIKCMTLTRAYFTSKKPPYVNTAYVREEKQLQNSTVDFWPVYTLQTVQLRT